MPDAVIIMKCAAYHVEIILQRGQGRLLNCFQLPACLTSHFLSDFAMLSRADVLWVELFLCNSWQAWIVDPGYTEDGIY